MLNRIELILQTQNLTVSQFADRVGVQRSALSHVLAGRNNPSLDFVTKILRTFPDIRSQWLLFGEGKMYDSLASFGAVAAEAEMQGTGLTEPAVSADGGMPAGTGAAVETHETAGRVEADVASSVEPGAEAMPVTVSEPTSVPASVTAAAPPADRSTGLAGASGQPVYGRAAGGESYPGQGHGGAADLPGLPEDFVPVVPRNPALTKVVFFYSDGHFEEYAPRETPQP